MSLILVTITGYILGSLPFSFWLGKFKGVDLRKIGSGNIGATNLARVFGAGWGLFAFILDAGKGFLAVTIAGYIFNLFNNNPTSLALIKIIGGIASILGHNYSMWVKFKGGKGVATSSGVFLALAPVPLLFSLVIWMIIFILTRYVSLASIIASVSLPILMWYKNADLPIIVFGCITCALILIRHSSNIKRLIQGKENRFKKR